MAIAAAHHAGVSIEDACKALGSFVNAKRRLEVKGEVNGITVYDDFAHHPEAILATLTALRDKVGGGVRILAVLEPRSNTMKMGVHKDEIAPALGRADEVFMLQPEQLPLGSGRYCKPMCTTCLLECKFRSISRYDCR